MHKKLVLHIGANKTGSSAIQRFLAINSPVLREEGVVVPDSNFQAAEKTQGQHVFGFQKLLQSPQEGREHLENSIEAVNTAYPEASTILLSAENLTADPAAPSLFENLVNEYDTRIVLYIRRQDEYILSSWQQWNSKISTDFWAWILSVSGVLGDWRAYLQNWETVIQRENISVRVYERSKLEDEDVISDFYNILGVSRPFDTLAYPKDVVNPSFSDAIMDLVKGNELIFQNVHDNDFYNFVIKMTGEKYTKSSRQSPITFAQRQAILGKYKEQNDWVKKNYFPEARGQLFTPPRESEYEYVSSENLEHQKLEFLTTMLYQMYKRGGE